MFAFIILCSIAYLLGSINTALIACQLTQNPDPRTQGSGNAGATNVFRTASKSLAIVVFIGDAFKGFLPVLLAHVFNVSPFIQACVLMAAVLGHIYPLYFSFKGGKGVATALGGLLALDPLAALLSALAFGITFYFYRTVSIASLCAFVFAPLFVLFRSPTAFLPLLILSALIFYTHQDNIRRIMKGEEYPYKK